MYVITAVRFTAKNPWTFSTGALSHVTTLQCVQHLSQQYTCIVCISCIPIQVELVLSHARITMYCCAGSRLLEVMKVASM